MNPIDYYTEDEVRELIYRVGDVIMDVDLRDKSLPDKYQTGYLMLKTAHSMLGDLLPDTEAQAGGEDEG